MGEGRLRDYLRFTASLINTQRREGDGGGGGEIGRLQGKGRKGFKEEEKGTYGIANF